MLRSASAALLLLATGCGSACAPKASLRGLSIESDLEAGRAAGAARFDHGAWGRVLAAAAAPERGRFDYDAVPRADLDAYLLQLERAPLATLPGDEQVELAREALTAPSVKLMETVAGAIKEDLARVKDVLDIFVRTGMNNASELVL